MSAALQPEPPWRAALASLRRLPDMRAAIEALLLFLLVLGFALALFSAGVFPLRPLPRVDMAPIFWTAFLFPGLAEEVGFRSWLDRISPLPFGLSLGAFVLWHPLQVALELPSANPAFSQPAFLAVAAMLGVACTISRIRSGSIWPAVVIHWGIAVLWGTLLAG